MQETKIRTPAEDRPPPRSGWIRLVAMLGVGALLIGTLYGVWQAVASSDDPGQTVPREPDFSLTDEQAIARFKELESLQVSAYENVDLTAVSDFAGPGPFKDKVVQELRKLKRDRVTATLELETEELRVESNTPEQVDLHQSVITNIRFFDLSGNEVTTRGKPERWIIDWKLQNFDSRWLISSSVITETESIR
jgi:hypothetical protein